MCFICLLIYLICSKIYQLTYVLYISVNLVDIHQGNTIECITHNLRISLKMYSDILFLVEDNLLAAKTRNKYWIGIDQLWHMFLKPILLIYIVIS